MQLEPPPDCDPSTEQDVTVIASATTQSCRILSMFALLASCCPRTATVVPPQAGEIRGRKSQVATRPAGYSSLTAAGDRKSHRASLAAAATCVGFSRWRERQ